MTILDVIKEQLNKRQPMDATSKNLIRFMTATCGYGEVRLLASQRLEMWLQNPKVSSSNYRYTFTKGILISISDRCNERLRWDLLFFTEGFLHIPVFHKRIRFCVYNILKKGFNGLAWIWFSAFLNVNVNLLIYLSLSDVLDLTKVAFHQKC